VIIAGAGGPRTWPGMTAAKTRLPVLGVPVQSKALSGSGLAALDRADAARRPGRHARDRRRRRGQRRPARASIIALRDPAVAGKLDAYRAAQTARVLAEALP